MLVTSAEFSELFRSVTSWGRWGGRDGRGSLNRLVPDECRAPRLVREGMRVS